MAGYLSRSLLLSRNWVKECKKCRSDLKHQVIQDGEWKGYKYVNPSVRILQVYNDCYDRAVVALPEICATPRIGKVSSKWLEDTVPREKFLCRKHDLQSMFIRRFATFIIRIWVQNVNDVLNGLTSNANDKVKVLARKHCLAAKKRKAKVDKWKALEK